MYYEFNKDIIDEESRYFGGYKDEKSSHNNDDGECAVHFDQPMTYITDEEGYTNGFYAVSGSKVYINCGGSVYADVYEMSGNTLTKTSQIEVYQG